MKNAIKLLADAGKSSAFGLAASGRVLRGMVLLFVSGLMSGVSQSLGAKTGNIAISGSNAEIVAGVLGDQTPNMTLGQLVAAELLAAPDALFVDIDLGTRTVKTKLAANAPTLTSSSAEITFDEPSKRVSSVTMNLVEAGTDITDAGANVEDSVKPTFSLSSLISRLEDSFLGPIGVDRDLNNAHIIVDQAQGKVIIVRAASMPAVNSPVATATQTFDVAGGVTRLPFE